MKITYRSLHFLNLHIRQAKNVNPYLSFALQRILKEKDIEKKYKNIFSSAVYLLKLSYAYKVISYHSISYKVYG